MRCCSPCLYGCVTFPSLYGGSTFILSGTLLFYVLYGGLFFLWYYPVVPLYPMGECGRMGVLSWGQTLLYPEGALCSLYTQEEDEEGEEGCPYTDG
jgi:hypothetical protein